MHKRRWMEKTPEEIAQDDADRAAEERAAYRKYLALEASGGMFTSVRFTDETPEVDKEADQQRKAAIEKAEALRNSAIQDYVESNMLNFRPSTAQNAKKSANTEADTSSDKGAEGARTVQTKFF